MKSVLVTGANGQLGKTLQCLYSESTQDIQYHFFSKTELDITNPEHLRNVFQKLKPTHCVNCAAYTNVDGAETNRDLAMQINYEGAKTLAKICSSLEVALIHISTDYVFDGESSEPYKTTDSPNPINCYGKSKHLGEQAVIEHCKTHFILRTSWLYSHYSGNFLDFIFQKAKTNSPLKITIENIGSPTSCLSLSKFIHFLIETQEIPFGIYHYSGQGETTWYGFAREILKYVQHYDLQNLKETSFFKTLGKRPKYSVLDLGKTLNYYSDMPSWKEALMETIALRE